MRGRAKGGNTAGTNTTNKTGEGKLNVTHTRGCQSKTGSENHIETQKKTHELDTRTGDNRHENTHDRPGDKLAGH